MTQGEISKERVRGQFDIPEDEYNSIDVTLHNNSVTVSIDGWVHCDEIPDDFSFKVGASSDGFLGDTSISFDADKEDLGDEYREEPNVVEQIASDLGGRGFEYEEVEYHGVEKHSDTFGYIDGLSDSFKRSGCAVGINKKRELEDEYDVRLSGSLLNGKYRLFVHEKE